MDMITIDRIVEELEQFQYFQKVQRFKSRASIKEVADTLMAIGRCKYPFFTIDDNNKSAYTNFLYWIMGSEKMEAIDPTSGEIIKGDLNKGIYIAGRSGTGKSDCMELMSYLCRLLHVPVQFGQQKRGLSWLNYRAADICDAYAKGESLERFKQMPILGIQDLGSEPDVSSNMGNKNEVLRQIIEYRGDRQDLITMFTSNYPPNHAEIERKYGDRVVSRLFSMCNYLIINGNDRRKMK